MRYRLRIEIIFFVWIFPIIGFAQDYLWPTDASHWITSAFGEHRPRRLHAAIDIKTWGQSGYKIFAVRDGYVSRIRVSPSGYGKAVYLKLDNGEIVVYAHLSGFNEALSEFVYQEQQKQNKYRVDRYLSAAAFPVKKGDFLGYTGETGIGVPHLHFEMRDAKNRPFNPFLRGYKIDDVQPPIIKGIAFIPLKFGTRINDDFVTQIPSLRQINSTHYELTAPVTFEGDVGVAVHAFDRSGTVNNAFGVYKLSLYIDGQHFFSTQFDKFSYAYNRFMELDREYRLQRRGFGKYYRLFLDEENPLSFYTYRGAEKGRLLYDSTQTTGLLSNVEYVDPDSLLRMASNNATVSDAKGRLFLNGGKHALTVFVQDFFGNTSSISGTLIAGKKVELTPQYNISDNNIVLENVLGLQSIPVSKFQVWKKEAHGPNAWKLFDEIALKENSETGKRMAFDPVQLFPKTSIHAKPHFQFIAVDSAGLASWSAFLMLPSKNESGEAQLKIDADFYDDWARFHFTSSVPLRKAPLVELTSGDGSTNYPKAIQAGETEYILPVSFAQFAGARVRVLLSGETISGDFISADTTFDNFHMQRDRSGVILSPDSVLQVQFTSNSLYRDLYGRARFYSRRDASDPDAVSDVYTAEPQDVPLNQGATVRLKYPEDVVDPSKLGVYYMTSRGWSFIDNNIDTLHQFVSAKVFSLEEFTVRKDDTIPQVKIYTPQQGQRLGQKPEFKVWAKDKESGFPSEESLLMQIDGKKAIAEYDPETGLLRYKPRTPLKAGQHEFLFTAEDRSGNKTQVSRTFYVN